MITLPAPAVSTVVRTSTSAPRPGPLALPEPAAASPATVEIGDARLQPVADDGGENVRIQASVGLGTLLPSDVNVDVLPVHGRPPGRRCRMLSVGHSADGSFLYEATSTFEEVGRAGCDIRVSSASQSGSASALRPVVRRVPPLGDVLARGCPRTAAGNTR
jgi:hypothetical protein